MTRMTSVLKARVGLVQFPGSNCDQDCIDALARHFGINSTLVWHDATQLPPVDAVILPGGFSFGDYLRSGALASHSPVMAAVRRFAQGGGPVLGICNGFQVLTESGLLPGALLGNMARRFICKYVNIKAEPGPSPLQGSLAKQVLSIPIAHGEGRYYVGDEDLRRLQGEGQIAFSYTDSSGAAAENPNGSTAAIAGVLSANRRVLGMMPHPERATDELIGGSSDGLKILQAFLELVH